MAEREQQHRHHFLESQIELAASQQKLGTWLGFIIAFLAILGGIVLIYLDKEWAGTAVTGTTLTTIVTAFVLGRKGDSEDRKSKTD